MQIKQNHKYIANFEIFSIFKLIRNFTIMSINKVWSCFVLRSSIVKRTPKKTCGIFIGQNGAVFIKEAHGHAVKQRLAVGHIYLSEHSLGPVNICYVGFALVVIAFNRFLNWKKNHKRVEFFFWHFIMNCYSRFTCNKIYYFKLAGHIFEHFYKTKYLF